MQNDSILFIVKMPTSKNQKDGMVQRELAIDELFKGYKRVYVSDYNLPPLKVVEKVVASFLPHKKCIIKDENVVSAYYMPPQKFYKLCKNSKFIYCHSLFMLNKLSKEIIEEFKDKIVVDIHGCVVEELIMNGAKSNVVERMQDIENFAFNRVKLLIAVSDNMIDFYKEKYPGIKTEFLKLPIFSSVGSENKIKSKKLKIVYSGGIQKWQNVDLMLDTISQIADKFDIQILTPYVDEFLTKLQKYDIASPIDVKCVAPNELDKEYKSADFGFVLRDDIIVNKVSCPTKIIEYLNYGIIPIVIQPNIGDFNNMNYSYILNSDLLDGNIPDDETIEKMRINNYSVLEKLNAVQREGKSFLVDLVKN